MGLFEQSSSWSGQSEMWQKGAWIGLQDREQPDRRRCVDLVPEPSPRFLSTSEPALRPFM